MTDSSEADIRLKRLRIRSWRRGTREMDLILGGYADRLLASLGPGELDAYEALLEENDHDIYLWVSGRLPAPEAHGPTLGRLRDFHAITAGRDADA